MTKMAIVLLLLSGLCLASSVNNGKIGFSKDLFTVSGSSGLSYTLSLSYNNDMVYDDVRSDNNNASPSQVGLGWSMATPHIFLQPNGCLQLADESGMHQLVPSGADPSQGSFHDMVGWTFKIFRQGTDDNVIMGIIAQNPSGVRYHYGNTSGSYSTLNNLNGVSYTYATFQLRDHFSETDRLFTYEWMLTKIETYDRTDSITFEYYDKMDSISDVDQFAVEHIRVPISGDVLDRYITRKQYLKKIKSPNRSQVTLYYSNTLTSTLPKDPTYLYPEPDANPDQIYNRYLDHVDYLGQTLGSNTFNRRYQLEYAVCNIQAGQSNYDKRILTKLHLVDSYRKDIYPPIVYSYNTLVDQTNNPNYVGFGSLRAIRDINGRQTNFKFSMVQKMHAFDSTPNFDGIIYPGNGFFVSFAGVVKTERRTVKLSPTYETEPIGEYDFVTINNASYSIPKPAKQLENTLAKISVSRDYTYYATNYGQVNFILKPGILTKQVSDLGLINMSPRSCDVQGDLIITRDSAAGKIYVYRYNGSNHLSFSTIKVIDQASPLDYKIIEYENSYLLYNFKIASTTHDMRLILPNSDEVKVNFLDPLTKFLYNGRFIIKFDAHTVGYKQVNDKIVQGPFNESSWFSNIYEDDRYKSCIYDVLLLNERLIIYYYSESESGNSVKIKIFKFNGQSFVLDNPTSTLLSGKLTSQIGKMPGLFGGMDFLGIRESDGIHIYDLADISRGSLATFPWSGKNSERFAINNFITNNAARFIQGAKRTLPYTNKYHENVRQVGPYLDAPARTNYYYGPGNRFTYRAATNSGEQSIVLPFGDEEEIRFPYKCNAPAMECNYSFESDRACVERSIYIDYNQDGEKEKISFTVDDGKFVNSWSNALPFFVNIRDLPYLYMFYKFFPGDFDADGNDDLMVVCWHGIDKKLSFTPMRFINSSPVQMADTWFSDPNPVAATLECGDYNFDGKTDFFLNFEGFDERRDYQIFSADGKSIHRGSYYIPNQFDLADNVTEECGVARYILENAGYAVPVVDYDTDRPTLRLLQFGVLSFPNTGRNPCEEGENLHKIVLHDATSGSFYGYGEIPNTIYYNGVHIGDYTGDGLNDVVYYCRMPASPPVYKIRKNTISIAPHRLETGCKYFFNRYSPEEHFSDEVVIKEYVTSGTGADSIEHIADTAAFVYKKIDSDPTTDKVGGYTFNYQNNWPVPTTEVVRTSQGCFVSKKLALNATIKDWSLSSTSENLLTSSDAVTRIFSMENLDCHFLRPYEKLSYNTNGTLINWNHTLFNGKNAYGLLTSHREWDRGFLTLDTNIYLGGEPYFIKSSISSYPDGKWDWRSLLFVVHSPYKDDISTCDNLTGLKYRERILRYDGSFTNDIGNLLTRDGLERLPLDTLKNDTIKWSLGSRDLWRIQSISSYVNQHDEATGPEFTMQTDFIRPEDNVTAMRVKRQHADSKIKVKSSVEKRSPDSRMVYANGVNVDAEGIRVAVFNTPDEDRAEDWAIGGSVSYLHGLLRTPNDQIVNLNLLKPFSSALNNGILEFDAGITGLESSGKILVKYKNSAGVLIGSDELILPVASNKLWKRSHIRHKVSMPISDIEIELPKQTYLDNLMLYPDTASVILANYYPSSAFVESRVSSNGGKFTKTIYDIDQSPLVTVNELGLIPSASVVAYSRQASGSLDAYNPSIPNLSETVSFQVGNYLPYWSFEYNGDTSSAAMSPHWFTRSEGIPVTTSLTRDYYIYGGQGLEVIFNDPSSLVGAEFLSSRDPQYGCMLGDTITISAWLYSFSATASQVTLACNASQYSKACVLSQGWNYVTATFPSLSSGVLNANQEAVIQFQIKYSGTSPCSHFVLDGVVIEPGTIAHHPSTTRTFMDAAGRVLEVVQYKLNRDNILNGLDSLIIAANIYDPLGRICKKFLPVALPAYNVSDGGQLTKYIDTITVKSVLSNKWPQQNPWSCFSYYEDGTHRIYRTSIPGKGCGLENNQFHTEFVYHVKNTISGDSLEFSNTASLSDPRSVYRETIASTQIKPGVINRVFTVTNYRNTVVSQNTLTVTATDSAIHNKTVYQFDHLGQMKMAILPSNFEITSDFSTGKKQEVSLDGRGLLLRHRETQSGGYRENRYDQFGVLRFYQDPNCRALAPDSDMFIANIYDLQGRLSTVARVTAARTAFNNKDFLDNPCWPKPSDVSTFIPLVTKSYDDYGRLVRVGAITVLGKELISLFNYDSLDRIIKLTEQVPNNQGGTYVQTHSYTYGRDFRVMTYRFDCATSPYASFVRKFEYDDFGRLVRLKTLRKDGTINTEREEANYQYNDPQGVLSKAVYGNILESSYDYNMSGNLIKQNVHRPGNSTSLFKEELAYGNFLQNDDISWLSSLQPDANFMGKLIGVRYTGLNPSSPSQSRMSAYFYDSSGRVTSTKYQDLNGNPSSLFSSKNQYDADGTILAASKTLPQPLNGKDTVYGEYIYDTETHRLTSVQGDLRGINETAGVNFVYDANGNLVEDKAKNMTIEYDWRNMPVRFIMKKSGKIVFVSQMLYDASGNRVAKMEFTRN